MQRDIGVDVRILDLALIPEWLRARVFDFVLFDEGLCYEMSPATTFNEGRGIVRTLLTSTLPRVRDLKNQYEKLWNVADPKHEIDQIEPSSGP
jgi:hypothetical protein